MSQENKVEESEAVEENNNPEGQASPNTASEEKAEQIAEAKRKIPFFDETASVMDDGGEINTILNQLYEACKEKNLPLIAAVNYQIEDHGDGFAVGLRGVQVIGQNGFAPANIHAMKAVMDSKTLAEMVLFVVRDKQKMGILELLGGLGK